MKNWKRILAAPCLLVSLNGLAQTVTLDLDVAYTGGIPAGDPPWLRAVLEPIDPKSVSLTLSAPNLTATEFTTRWAFRLDPDRFDAPHDVSISAPTILQGNISVTDSWFSPGDSGGWGNGGEVFDLEFEFRRSNGAGRFTGGEMVSFVISSDLGITPDDFLFRPKGGFYTAAHVQGLDDGGSVKVGADEFSTGKIPPEDIVPVPEAGTVGAGLALAGLVIGGALRRHSRGR